MWKPTSPTGEGSQPIRRFAQIVKLKSEHLKEYKEVHARVWPEVLKQIKDCHIEDCRCWDTCGCCSTDVTQQRRILTTSCAHSDSIYYDDNTHILFATFKYTGSDYEGDMKRMAENPKVREWWKMTDKWQESMVPGSVSSEAGKPSWWKPVEEVFYLP
jgi:L-rhamnose mutarotase